MNIVTLINDTIKDVELSVIVWNVHLNNNKSKTLPRNKLSSIYVQYFRTVKVQMCQTQLPKKCPNREMREKKWSATEIFGGAAKVNSMNTEF